MGLVDKPQKQLTGANDIRNRCADSNDTEKCNHTLANERMNKNEGQMLHIASLVRRQVHPSPVNNA